MATAIDTLWMLVPSAAEILHRKVRLNRDEPNDRTMRETTVAALNDVDRATFVDILGGVYEESPWVARGAWPERPFESVEDVEDAMREVVEAAPRSEQLALLRAHPDLGGRTEMTDASESEQASAGLDQLSPSQYEAFQRLNRTYREQFGFPFIMAVKGESVDAIRAAMECRIDHSQSDEFRTALDEVHEIARLRLREHVST
jgi:2-oxo-4-hydroxy-4-carboxy-5-ureidoimidazoline decarboxylase